MHGIRDKGILCIDKCYLSIFYIKWQREFFTQQMLKKGYLASTGLYVSKAHTDEIVGKYFEACEGIFEDIAKIELKKDITEYLDGPICHVGFERLN